MEKRIFEKMVSVYQDVTDRIGKQMPLGDFLFDGSQKDKILRIRSIEDKTQRNALKRGLPCATISGVFSPSRKAENLILHSGLICLDIDGQDNPTVSDWEGLKHQLAVLPQIAYCSLSLSGKGLFLIIPIKYLSFHKAHFMQLQEDFLKMGIVLDRNCGDVCRLRTLSYDADPYVNEQAAIYDRVKVEEPRFTTYRPLAFGDNNLDKVAKCCQQIELRHIDITSTYEEWIHVGFSLASLGEQGREFFHVCSRQNPKYKPADTDRKFDNLLKGNGGITIGTFFKICKDRDISLCH